MKARFCATLPILLALTVLTGCHEDNEIPAGLRTAQLSGGPKIVFDLDARPFPDVPFPNDLATRPDPRSPTGKRLNITELGATNLETRVRQQINRMDGFGLLGPFTVRFDAPLDLHDIARRHQQKIPDFSDDAIYVVNVDRKSPNYGRFILLDMGIGNYPVLHSRPDRYFPNDPRQHGNNLIFESVREVDLNGNGILDPIEDTNDDGTFSVPNTLDPHGDPNAPGQLMNWYERATNTLIMRPVVPLDPGTTYAIVLTSALRGEDGSPIDSAFEGINHTRQTEALTPLKEILPNAFPDRFDARLKDVRFAWSFTTGNPTQELVAVRNGLYGHGPLAWLHDQFPPEIHMIHNAKREGAANPMTFDLSTIIDFLVPLIAAEVGPATVDAVKKAFEDVDYVVSGSFLSPYFLADRDGLADTGAQLAYWTGNAADENEIFDIRLEDGYAYVKPGEVPFICSVPTENESRKAPFPVILYSHAISSTRLEILLFAGTMAKFGFAVCSIDAVGHGAVVPPEFEELIQVLTESLRIPNFAELLQHHRSRDVNNDGQADSGAIYFTADLLHARDNMRQTAIDQMQFIRILRTFDGTFRWPEEIDEESPYIQARRSIVAGWDQTGDGRPEIAGDFNGDGTVDFGGNRPMVALGTSLGGLQTSILAGVEPVIRAGVSNAGGGILSDVSARTTISNVRNGVQLRMFGPLLVGNITELDDENGERIRRMNMRWVLAIGDREFQVPFGYIDGIEDGDQITLRNLVRETREFIPEEDRYARTYVRNGAFRIAVASDALQPTILRALRNVDPKVDALRDIAGCIPQETCGENMCPQNHTCSFDDRCISLTQCLWDFNFEVADDTDLRIEMNRRTISDPREYGDALVLEFRSPSGRLKATIDSFPENAIFANMLYPKGAPLAALTYGWGLRRQTPDMRRFIGIAQTLLEPADPGIWATHYFKNPIRYPYEDPRFRVGGTNFLKVGTVGDQTVPINAAIAVARTAGMIEFMEPDPRYGVPENQFLIDNFVYEGISHLNRFPDYPNALFDADDLDEGRFRQPGQLDNPDPNPDAEHPLRVGVSTPWGVSGLRLAYLNVRGEHTFNAPDPSAPFDVASFMHNQVGWYLAHLGRDLRDELCFEDLTMEACPFFDPETFEPVQEFAP